jgi:hypothetical protein
MRIGRTFTMNRVKSAPIPHATRQSVYQDAMSSVASREQKVLGGPPCRECGGATRIVAIEPHRRLKRRHVWTLECLICETAQTAEMPAPRRTH